MPRTGTLCPLVHLPVLYRTEWYVASATRYLPPRSNRCLKSLPIKLALLLFLSSLAFSLIDTENPSIKTNHAVCFKRTHQCNTHTRPRLIKLHRTCTKLYCISRCHENKYPKMCLNLAHYFPSPLICNFSSFSTSSSHSRTSTLIQFLPPSVVFPIHYIHHTFYLLTALLPPLLSLLNTYC